MTMTLTRAEWLERAARETREQERERMITYHVAAAMVLVQL